MKRTITLYEFKRYIEKCSYSKILFESANQSWPYSPLRFHLSFTGMNIHFAPDLIYLKGACDDICMQCVEKVRVDDTDEFLIKVSITCGTTQKDIKNTFRLLLVKR